MHQGLFWAKVVADTVAMVSEGHPVSRRFRVLMSDWLHLLPASLQVAADTAAMVSDGHAVSPDVLHLFEPDHQQLVEEWGGMGPEGEVEEMMVNMLEGR